MGRTKENPRYHIVSFRVADDEQQRIAEYVAEGNKVKGSAIRELVLAAIRAKAGEGDD